ncbi:MAG TPA: hypothetical protein VLE46_13880 [Nitrospira sp.]|nr:hypothetical protein [Nitrospira sp.]
MKAINATIRWGNKTARGYRNVEHFVPSSRTALFLGGTDLSRRVVAIDR